MVLFQTCSEIRGCGENKIRTPLFTKTFCRKKEVIRKCLVRMMASHRMD